MKSTVQFLAIAFLLVVLGCEQVIPIDLPKQDPVLVLNCSFSKDSIWQASLTSSLSIQDTGGLPPVTNALILIEENGIVIDTLLHQGNDIYKARGNRLPEAGRTYSIRVSAPNFETVTGTDYLPAPVIPYDLLWRDSVSAGPFDERNGEVSFAMDDPGGEDNYYAAYIYRIDTFYDLGDTILYPQIITPNIQDPIFEYDVNSGGVLFADLSFNGQKRIIRFQISSNEGSGRQLFLGLSTCSYNYYNYIRTISAFTETGFNPFSEPVRIHSNMSSKMGIFAGFSLNFQAIP